MKQNKLDEIYDWVDSLLKRNDLFALNNSLSLVLDTINDEEIDLVLGWLTATLPAKKKLKNKGFGAREKICGQLRARLTKEKEPVEELLKGLE